MFKPIFLDEISPGDRIAVAMSGGVDSSVAAALMAQAGYDVIGITLQLYDQGEMVQKKGACCAGQDIYDARQVADRLGFPHYVLDYESVFKKQVIDDFVDTYLQGQTPIPCVRCNQKVKFKDLLQTAQDLGAKALITGHYVRRKLENNRAHLLRASDTTRDQSYFLFATTQEQLNYLRFPLGDLESKTVTRDYARYFGLNVSEKPDSQDICFVVNGNYAQVVEKFRPGALDAGDIVDMEGNVLGHHQGIISYTIGQRKGLRLGGVKDPYYVIKINPHTKQVVVGPKEALARKSILVKDVNWLEDPLIIESMDDVYVKIRSANTPMKAKVTRSYGSSQNEYDAVVTLDQPEYGVSGGQACVFYHHDRVLGGGWISS